MCAEGLFFYHISKDSGWFGGAYLLNWHWWIDLRRREGCAGLALWFNSGDTSLFITRTITFVLYSELCAMGGLPAFFFLLLFNSLRMTLLVSRHDGRFVLSNGGVGGLCPFEPETRGNPIPEDATH